MRNRKLLKNVLNVLLVGWTFLIITIILLMFFPSTINMAATFTLFIGIIVMMVGIGGSMNIDAIDSFWSTLDDTEDAYTDAINSAKRAIAYKNVYKKLIIKKYGESEESLKKLADKELDKI